MANRSSGRKLPNRSGSRRTKRLPSCKKAGMILNMMKKFRRANSSIGKFPKTPAGCCGRLFIRNIRKTVIIEVDNEKID